MKHCKKTIFTLLLLAGMISLAQAQSPFHFGPKLGLSYSKLTFSEGDVRPSSDYYTGFHGGLFIRVDLGHWYIQPEVLYNQKGGKILATIPNGQAGNVVIKTLDVPLMIGVKVIDAKVANLRLMAGPVLSNTLQESSDALDRIGKGDFSINKRNVGYQAGVGIDIGTVTLDARYEGGLNKISSEFGTRPSLFLFSIGFKII